MEMDDAPRVKSTLCACPDPKLITTSNLKFTEYKLDIKYISEKSFTSLLDISSPAVGVVVKWSTLSRRGLQGRSQDFWFGGLIFAEVWAKFFRSENKTSACSGLFQLIKYNIEINSVIDYQVTNWQI